MKVTNNHPRLVNLLVKGKLVRVLPGQSTEVPDDTKGLDKLLKASILGKAGEAPAASEEPTSEAAPRVTRRVQRGE